MKILDIRTAGDVSRAMDDFKEAARNSPDSLLTADTLASFAQAIGVLASELHTLRSSAQENSDRQFQRSIQARPE